MNRKNPVFTLIFLLNIILFGCSKGPSFEVSDFNPFTGLSPATNDTLELEAGIQSDIFKSILIPGDGYFRITFRIKNNRDDRRFYYKIFYRNESYIFREFTGQADSIAYNPLAAENFYGSWEYPNDSVHMTPVIAADNEFHTVADSFRIIGNPRNESVYFGQNPDEMQPIFEKIAKVEASIKTTKEWYNNVVEKAKKNLRNVDEQLYLDALWIVKHNENEGSYNCRWKRNPRAGVYSVMLLITEPENFSKLPPSVRNIEKKQGDTLFIDPYFTFFDDPERDSSLYSLLKTESVLKTRIKFDLGTGIYVDPLKYTKQKLDSSSFGSLCNNSGKLFRLAQTEQFFHSVDKSWVLNNVPVISDYDDFTVEDYKNMEKKYSEDQRKHDYLQITECPCKTVAYDHSDNSIVLTNPAATKNRLRKENVGIQSRVGFTYGKITAKIKFPAMLNKYGVWNGITNAFWLLYQGEGDWNQRRPCENGGYIPKYEVGKTDNRVRQTFYTEIDIEIVKASKHWPKTSYYNNIPFPANDPDLLRDITVTCTNWDLACQDPEKFNVGVFGVDHNGRTYLPHRWDHWYKALTEKYAINHDSVFDRDYYYYQIDWQPDRIIWRIGPDKQHMKEVGYLDTTVSSIPNNQMTFIVTQEYHHSGWWPTTPFKQEFIPYPARNIIGKVYEVEIE